MVKTKSTKVTRTVDEFLDGDTFKFKKEVSESNYIRLEDIETHEKKGERGYQPAKQALKKQIEGKKSVWDEMTNQYSLSKTLRFELKPVGNTLENIGKIIEEDKQRDKDFQEVKIIMNKYYSYYISKILNNKIKIDKPTLNEYKDIYFNLKKKPNDSDLKKQLESIQKKITKNISFMINSDSDFKKLFGKEFVKDILKRYLEEKGSQQELELVSKFSDWTTYFTGFYDNRKNVFSDKDIPTSIIYRIVQDNLPKYLDNLYNLEQLKELDIDFSNLNKDFKESLGNLDLFEYFRVENFNEFLSQEGIDKYNYLVGGYSKDLKDKKKGINEIINEYSQKNKEHSDIRKLKLTVLFKQILSEKNEEISFRFSSFDSAEEMLKEVNNFYKELNNENLFEKLGFLFDDLNNEKYDKNKIFIKKNKLTYFSNELFGNFSTINYLIKEYVKKNYFDCNTDSKFEKWFASKELFSLSLIEMSIATCFNYFDSNSSEVKKIKEIVSENFNKSVSFYLTQFKVDTFNLFDEIKGNYELFQELLNSNIFDKQNLTEEEKAIKSEQIEKLKSFLDSILKLNSFFDVFSTLNVKKEVVERDNDFYNTYENYSEKLLETISIYNKVRNYITKKKIDVKKFKLNFNSSYLLSGWSSDFETNASVIFIKDNNYYLGIVPKNLIKEEKEKLQNFDSNNQIKLMNYIFQKPNYRNVPRTFIRSKGDSFAPAVKEYNLPVNDILEIYDNEYYKPEFKKKNPELYKKSLIQLIDYFKLGFKNHSSYKKFNFLWKDSHEYENISDFYKDVENSCYELNFINLNYNLVKKLVEEGKLYLFQIYNKDFSKYSKGNKNLHTIYWEELFSEENLKDIVYKLNGKAEVFYREKAFEAHITHPKNKEIENKDPIKNKATSKFEYDLIKDKRYTYDKFLFHCPITLNFKAPSNVLKFNDRINKIIKKNSDEIKILSIDRGERHLAYYTLLNSKGDIEKQESFNLVKDTFGRNSDYHKKLEKLEGDRDKARKNWNTIENIKELKEGYLSQIIHKIAKIVIDENAIVVFEDLNFGFKRGRFKIEKQIYQKFEKMLIDKLNYLMFKDRIENTQGGALKAYQLTSKFETFQKLGKQTGIIFYVNASYTSKICPLTGFTNHIYPNYETIEKSKNLFEKFKSIKYNAQKDYFEFTYKVSDFNKSLKLIKNDWTLCTFGERLITSKDKTGYFKTEKINLTEIVKELFRDYSIEYETEDNLVHLISNQDDSSFFKSLIFYLKILLSLRNSYTESEVNEFTKREGENFNLNNYDYILSPVEKDGVFFDSRKSDNLLPKDADANGAYNIGLKGLILIDKIKNTPEDKKVDLKIEKQDYLNYIIKRNQ